VCSRKYVSTWCAYGLSYAVLSWEGSFSPARVIVSDAVMCNCFLMFFLWRDLLVMGDWILYDVVNM
jgi:hypothetical protein